MPVALPVAGSASTIGRFHDGVPTATVNVSAVCALPPPSIYSTVRQGPTSRVNGLDAPDQGVRQGPKCWATWLGDQPNILPLELFLIDIFLYFFWIYSKIPKGVKTVGCNGSTEMNVTPAGIKKVMKSHLWRKNLYKEKNML
jgi:hypothetical protein